MCKIGLCISYFGGSFSKLQGASSQSTFSAPESDSAQNTEVESATEERTCKSALWILGAIWVAVLLLFGGSLNEHRGTFQTHVSHSGY